MDFYRSPGKTVMNPNFGTQNLPTCVSTEDCTHWWAHHFDSSQGCRELYFTTRTSKTSTSTPTIAYAELTHLLVRTCQRRSEVNILLQFQNFWGVAAIMCDLIGEFANLLMTPPAQQESRILVAQNQVSVPKRVVIRDASFGSPLRLSE